MRRGTSEAPKSQDSPQVAPRDAAQRWSFGMNRSLFAAIELLLTAASCGVAIGLLIILEGTT